MHVSFSKLVRKQFIITRRASRECDDQTGCVRASHLHMEHPIRVHTKRSRGGWGCKREKMKKDTPIMARKSPKW